MARGWRRFLSSSSGGRLAGPPTSSNGASSLHLFWDVPGGLDAVAVQATLQVLAPPPPDRLVFWAIQASMGDGRSVGGTGHLGLQHHPRYPGRGAANWGGYRPGGGELPGGPLGAPSALANPNTCNFAWRPGVAYLLRIEPAAPGRWRGTVTDPAGAAFVVRELEAPGDRLSAPMVWTESFSRCEESSVARWSGFEAVERSGNVVPVGAVRVNYQAHGDGGCANTTARRIGDDGLVVEQATGTLRTVPQGTMLRHETR